jgi:hypothetical protein
VMRQSSLVSPTRRCVIPASLRHPERSRFSGGARDLARSEIALGARKIPRPAGESAGLRNDAEESALGESEPNAPLRHPERSRFSGGARDLARSEIALGARKILQPRW